MSEHKKSSTVNGIITSDAAYHSGGRRRWLWLAVAAMAVVVVVAGVVLYGHNNRKAPVKSNTTGTTQTKTAQTIQEQMASAVANAQQELANAKTPADKASAYKDLGMAYFNNQQYDQAIAAYNSAVSTDSSIKPQVLDTLAYVYATAGQRDKAIATYQELIALLQQLSNDGHTARVYEGADTTASTIQTYQHNIQVLQQGGSL